MMSSNKAPFSTSASLKKKHPKTNRGGKDSPTKSSSMAATEGVEGEVIYRIEGSKIVPVNPLDHVDSPISPLFSEFGNHLKPSSPEVTPIKNKGGAVDLSELTLKDVLPADEFVQQLITRNKFNMTVEELKQEVQRLLDVLPLSEGDPVRVQAEKEFWKNCKAKEVDVYRLASSIMQFTRVNNLIDEFDALLDGAPMTLAMYKIGIDNGDFIAKYSYGIMLYRGARGVPADKAKGRAIIESLAKPKINSPLLGLPPAMAALAGIYARDDKNYEAARDMYLAASKKGIVEARVALGRMYLNGELPVDHNMARKCFEEVIKSENDNAEAHFLLGTLDMMSLEKESGEEEQDEGKRRSKQKSAFQHYQKAASKGLPEAQYNVGLAYFRGQGVPKNDALAIEYWKMSGQQGFGLAQLSLGAYYFQDEQPEGQGEKGSATTNQGWDPSKKDLMQAQKWFTLASRRPGEVGLEGQRLKAKVDEAIKKGGGGRKGRFCTIM
ncbi:hypothetical protein BGZ80_000078 [Entomortierella chlamydospora]|uniref:Chitin synthase activator n=1 Tax=Entomortierella chlamydospora TaxID=101097 RepID=A0A9P6N3C3_9FUNG|nr:hypothetical protein BGZ80_000078 [Entomortierella chlamydospora]